jgi:hypothetical protein
MGYNNCNMLLHLSILLSTLVSVHTCCEDCSSEIGAAVVLVTSALLVSSVVTSVTASSAAT